MPPAQFNPDWISAPGDTMTDILEEKNLSLIHFAEQIGYEPKHARELLQGQRMLTLEIARKLEGVLGASAEFWMIRESQFRESLIQVQSQPEDLSEIGWLKELPLNDMVRFGWVKRFRNHLDQVAECLRFFAVPGVKCWRDTYQKTLPSAAFRTSPSFESQPGALAAWFRQAEIQGASIVCEPWDADRFRDVLVALRPLTRKKDPKFFISEITKHCAKCGVAVVIVRAPTGCRASGATRFVSKNRALLILSCRYLSDDHFWFTFFHEAGHLVLHGKNALFVEGIKPASNIKESQANEFSAEILIPREFQSELLSLKGTSLEIIKLAKRVGVSPGIIVGQLQYLGRIKRDQLNHLKRRFQWSSN